MKRLLVLCLLLFATPLLAQDIRPSAYLGQAGKVTVRSGKVLGSTGGVTTIAEQTITPANSATTYIYIDLSSTPAVATSTSGFPSSNYFPICTVIKDANGIITSFTDSRPDFFMAGSGSGSPSSLSNFFGQFFGLSPKDSPFNAFGDFKFYYDCGMATNNHVTCPTSTPFVVGDIGKVVEMTSTYAPTTVQAGTITAFNSSSDVTVSFTAGSTFTNKRMGYGHDDTTALLAWVTAMNAAPVAGSGPARGGYLPKGGYYTTAPLKFVSPYSSYNAANTGECGPLAVGFTAGEIACGPWIVGAGPTSSQIIVATAGQFNWSAGTHNQCAVYFFGWQFSNINSFAILADSSAHNVTGFSGNAVACGLGFDHDAHNKMDNMWVAGFRSTGNNLVGIATSADDFESTYTNSASEENDNNFALGLLCADIPTTACGTNTNLKTTLDTVFLESPNWSGAVQLGQGRNLQIGPGAGTMNIDQMRLRNINDQSGQVVGIYVNSLSQTVANDVIVIESPKCAGSIGVEVVGTARVDINNPTITSTGKINVSSASASTVVSVFGGFVNGNINTTGSSLLYLYGTNVVGTKTGNVFGFFPTTTGWSGAGVNQGTSWYSNQGTACATGNFALSAGWGTTATVTTAQGFGQTCKVTITSSGTGQAANPTVTWTLPSAAPTATVIGTSQMTGGTGAITLFDQTTLSATAPVWTFQGTPVAASTYITVFRMGP